LLHGAFKTIYTGGILTLLLYGVPVWKSVLSRFCYKAKLIRIQKLINLRITKAYLTVSNEAVCVINGIIPINIETEEIGKFYEITKGIETQYDRELENWNHPATHVKIIEGYQDNSHPIQAYTDGSKNDVGVGARIAIFLDNNLTATLKYRLNGRCTNNEEEQLSILKALQYIQYAESGGKSVLVHTDSQITLQFLQNQKKHTRLVEQIITRLIEMEQHEWRVEFSWIKAHARPRGNEMSDQLANEAANNKNIEECHNKIPNSPVLCALKEQSVQQWQNKWERSSKGAITKSFFPKREDRLKLGLNATHNFTAIVTGHGNIKSYLYKYKIIANPMCPFKKVLKQWTTSYSIAHSWSKKRIN